MLFEEGKATLKHQEDAMTCRDSEDRLTCSNNEPQERCERTIRVHMKQNVMLSRYISIADASTQEFKDFMSRTYPLHSMRVIGCLNACDAVLDSVLSPFESETLDYVLG
jgi:hypothetical protein